MPLRTTSVATEGVQYATLGLFVGPVDHTHSLLIDVSDLTDDEVDDDGYLKPGVPFKIDGTLLDGTADEVLFGVTVEPVKVHTSNSGLGSVTDDLEVAVATIGQINRDIAEDNLGRAYTSDELAGFAANGALVLLPT